MKPRIAAFLNDIGPAVLPRKEQKNLFGVVLKESGLEQYAKMNYAGTLIPITRNASAPPSSDENVLDDAILYTNILKQLKRNGIDTVLVPAQQSSRRIVNWAHDHHMTLLQVPHALGRRLEDKIRFDTLMRERDITVPPRIDIQKFGNNKNGLAVIQKRSGCGGLGTSILRLGDLPKNRGTDSMLIRKYINGVPLGISIIVDAEGNYFCSALRRQCFVMDKKNSPQLLGLQWVPTKSFSKKSLSAIERMTAQLIAFFLDIHFVGVANIDFILAQDGAYVIECNPRFSGATPQVFSKKQLTPHPHPWRFLMNAFLRKKNAAFHESSIPLSAYTGSLTYIDAEKKINVLGNVPVGTYAVRDGTAHLSGPGDKWPFFLLHDLPKYRSTVDKGDTICYILSDTPLFSPEGKLTEKATTLRSACFKLFTPY